MNIKIKGVDIEVTEALQSYASKKIGEVLEKFTNSINQKNVLVDVELSKTTNHHNSGEMYKASTSITGLHKNLFVEAVRDDLYAAIDELKDKIAENLAEQKDKKHTMSYKFAKKFKDLFKKGEI